MDNKNGDFGDQNVLSYIYEKKVHQSLKMGAKNEHRIGLIQSQFKNDDKLRAFEAKAMNPDEIYKKTEQEQAQRLNDRKKKEIEAKYFQDKQVNEKKERKQLEQMQKIGDQERIMKDVNEHHLKEKLNKEAKAQKVRDYAEQIKMQSEIKPNKFAKTGVAIIKNQS